jgi:hypothetical protein
MSYVLWNEAMQYNPKNPQWFNRDRFVLSAGHGSMLQYALLHLAGFDSVKVRHQGPCSSAWAPRGAARMQRWLRRQAAVIAAPPRGGIGGWRLPISGLTGP